MQGIGKQIADLRLSRAVSKEKAKEKKKGKTMIFFGEETDRK